MMKEGLMTYREQLQKLLGNKAYGGKFNNFNAGLQNFSKFL